jgi:hypothetical protein
MNPSPLARQRVGLMPSPRGAVSARPAGLSRRLGHGSPSITLDVYSHLFKPTDRGAADVFDAAFGDLQAE